MIIKQFRFCIFNIFYLILQIFFLLRKILCGSLSPLLRERTLSLFFSFLLTHSNLSKEGKIRFFSLLMSNSVSIKRSIFVVFQLSNKPKLFLHVFIFFFGLVWQNKVPIKIGFSIALVLFESYRVHCLYFSCFFWTNTSFV